MSVYYYRILYYISRINEARRRRFNRCVFCVCCIPRVYERSYCAAAAAPCLLCCVSNFTEPSTQIVCAHDICMKRLCSRPTAAQRGSSGGGGRFGGRL